MNADDFLDFDRSTYLSETDKLLGLPKGWSAAQIRVESNDDPTAVSRAGAMGLAQVMPKTLRTLSQRAGRQLDPFNEADALYIHREAMKENLGKFVNADDAARAYNNGWNPGSWNNPETAAYAGKIRAEIAEPGSARLKAGNTAAKRALSADAFLDMPDTAALGETSIPISKVAPRSPGTPIESGGALDYLKRIGSSIVKSTEEVLANVGEHSTEAVVADYRAREGEIKTEIANVVRGAERGEISQQDRKARIAHEIAKLKELETATRAKLTTTPQRTGAVSGGMVSAAAFLDAPDGVSQDARGIMRKAADLGLGIGGSVIDAIGALPTAAGAGLKSASDLTFGTSREEVALRMAEAGSPERTEDVYQRLNRYEPLNVLGRATDAMGRDLHEVAEKVRGLRSPEAVENARKSQMQGDITKPSTWSFGEDPSVEGVVQNTADVVGSMAPVVVSAVATRGRSVGTQVAAGAAAGAGSGVGQAVNQARDTIGRMSGKQLAQESPVYRELLAAGYAEADAKTWLTEMAERHAAALTAPVSAAGGAATSAILSKLGGNALERVAKTAVARTLLGAGVTGLEEGVQEVGENTAANSGVNSATGMNRDVMDGSFANFVGGALGGGMVGGARGAAHRPSSKVAPLRAEELLDVEPEAAALLALPGPVVRVDGSGNARMDGIVSPVTDEPAARVSGRAEISPTRQAVRDELKALGYDTTPRATPTPITVDADGNAVTDEQTPVRPTGVEPAARKIGRAEVTRAELAKLGFEPSAPRAQQTPITVDGEGNARTDEQSVAPVGRDESLGDLPRATGRAPVDAPAAPAAPEVRGLGHDATQRATATPISVNPSGEARLQGEERSGDQIANERLAAEAAKLFPNKRDEARRTEWIDARRQREMGYENRIHELADKANAKRAQRKTDIEQTSTAVPRALSPTSELGVVSQAEPDGSTSYFFYANPEEKLTVKPGASGARAVAAATQDEATQTALLRAALADGPLEATVRTLSPKAMQKAGAASDRDGTARLVGKAASKAKMGAELNRMAAKTADTLLAKAPIAGDDIGMARAAIAADPRRSASLLRGKDADAMIAGLREIAGEQAQPTAAREAPTSAAYDDFDALSTDGGRDAVRAGHMTHDEHLSRLGENSRVIGERDAALESEDAPSETLVRRSSRLREEIDSLSRRSGRAGEAAGRSSEGASRNGAPAVEALARKVGADEDIRTFAESLGRGVGRAVDIVGVSPKPGSASANLAREVSDRLGVDLRFFTSDDPAVPKGGVDPRVPGVLFVNAATTRAPYIVGHEMLHELRRAHPDLYVALREALGGIAKTLHAQEQAIRDDYRDGGVENLSKAVIAEENVADVAGLAFERPEFWSAFDRALKGDTGKLRQFFRWASRWLARTFGSKIDLDAKGGLQRAANAMRQDIAEAYAEMARRKSTVRSIAADMEFGVRRTGRMPEAAQQEKLGSVASRVGVGAIKSTAPITVSLQAANKAVDTIGSEIARLTGVKALGAKAVSLAERAVDAKSSWTWLEKVKQGVVADYGLPEEYLDAKLGKQVRENKLMREAKGTLDRLSAMTPDQLAVAYQWLQEKPDSARERELIGKLPAARQDVMRQMKTDIDNLSKEAVKLGLITQETYERNKMAYVHRSYKKYEAELTSSQAVARQRAQRLKGDQFKGRGMELEASLDRVRGDLPADLKGLKLEMLEKRDASGKLVRREYLVEGTKRPAALEEYTSAGTWEVRDATRKGGIKIWRDFTLPERQRMGEIEDARYGFARTMLQGIRDVETSRFLQWAAINYGKDSDAGLDVVEISGAHAALGSQTFTRDQWVKVPETKIKGTAVARYGDLAGKYLPAVMYSDLTGSMELRHGLWDKLLGAWKISKTALSPGVHVNNVMSNFVMADLAEVGVNDIRKALQTIVASKGGDAAAKALIERYEDSGAESGSFAANEIKTAVIEPLLKQIAESEPEAVQRASLANVVALAAHGHLREAGVALTKTLPGRATGAAFDAMLKAYQSEDSVFRLAKFMNEIEAGKTDVQAGKAARDAFLNYDINAPWVRAARRSVLPFISFTYRAVPLLAKAVVTKPWKVAKYAALGEALSMLAYMALGAGGDEEKEKRLLPDEMQGTSLGLPKMLRLPWNDKANDPMWLDVRRWLPGGDLTETNSRSALPVLQWLSIGGPLTPLIDIYTNTNWRGDKIVKPTDTAGEVMMKVSDLLAKFMLPNLPAPGLGWVLRKMGAPIDSGMLDPYGWAGIERGMSGAKTGFGKEVDTGIQTARALGLKLDPRRLSDEAARIGLDARGKEKVIETDARSIGRKMGRGEISREEGQRRIAREVEKLKELGKKTREKLAPTSH